MLPSSGAISFSQLRTVLGGGTGSVAMSTYASLAGLSRSPNVKISQFYSQSYTQALGLQFRCFTGYFNDDVTWFDRQTETSSGLTSNFTNISTSTKDTYTVNGTNTNFSIEWFGNFYAPYTGTYTFTLRSDDASYLWIGSTALAGYTTSNTVISNGGEHGMTSVSGSKALTAGTYNPIRIQFGQGPIGLYGFEFSFSGPNITTMYDMTGYVFYGLGTTSSFPSNAARLIKTATSTNTDGVYYINVNGTSTATYCLMNSAWGGGGWMMMMKATTGSTFSFASTYWTDSGTTLNTGDTNRNNADAKFNIMNYGMIKDVLAVWPDAGQTGGSIASPPDSWTWQVNNYYLSGTRATLLTGLAVANSRDSPVDPSPWNFAGYSNTIWSSQGGANRHVFGGGSHLAGGALWPYSVRWGFIWNNENDFASVDAINGIGLTMRWNSITHEYSAGDDYRCCGTPPTRPSPPGPGQRTTMRVELYAR